MAVPEDLLHAAREALERAYAPYSGFPVGAALRAEGGAVYGGCNVENASFPASQCAEASALGTLVSGGHREVREVLVLTATTEPVAPCGFCRQRLLEHAAPDTPVHLCTTSGATAFTTLGELLPLGFEGRLLPERA